MFRREEVIEHGRKAERLDDRAIREAERGHYEKAAHLEHRSDIQRAEMMGAAMGPPMVDPYYRPVAVGVEVGMVTAEAVRAEERREIREAEMIAAATRPVYPAYPPARVDVYVEPGMPGAYPGAGYPPGAYPPAGAPGYGYPPGAYPPPGEYYPPRY